MRRLAVVTVAAMCAALATPAPAQESAAVFDAPVVVGGSLQRFESIADLDGDGDTDVWGWWWKAQSSLEEAELVGWLNDGSGRLVQSWTKTLLIPAGNEGKPDSAATGNVDGDARADFALAFDGQVWIYTSNGAAAPTLADTYLHGAPIVAIALADFDDDGLDDLAVRDEADLHLLRNLGRGFLPVASTPAAHLEDEDALHVVEANGDGLPDLATLRDGQVDLYHVENLAFTGQQTLDSGLAASPVTHLVAGDVDGDRDQDLVVFGGEGIHTVLRCVGAGAFLVELPAAGGPATDLHDVDGDGDLDGTCCSSGGSGPGQTWINGAPSLFEIALNDGTGLFAPSFGIPGLGAHHLAGADDLDGDGDLDLVAGRVVYYGDGPLAGPPLQALEQPSPLLDLPVHRGDVADFDGDGDPDPKLGKDGALRNLGDGSMQVVLPIIPAAPAGSYFRGPGYPADWDGDGDADLLISRVSGGWYQPTFHAMRLLVNDGAGAFFDGGDVSPEGVPFHVKAPTFPDPYWHDDPQRAVVADADGDGDLDFLARAIEDDAYTPSKTMIFWNDGTGQFSVGPVFTGENVQAVADLDGDTVPDLVLGGAVKVRFGQGGGTFGNPVLLSGSGMDSQTDRLAAEDLDGDGDVDIALVHWTSEKLQLWVNDGAGSFTLDEATFAGYPGTSGYDRDTQAADLDDDGLTDLVWGPVDYAVNSSWVALRKADDSGWETPVAQVLQIKALADADGDGDVDALSDVLARNRTHEGPGAGARLQYGAGTASGAGVTPVFGASGPFRVGETIGLHITGATAGMLGVLSVGLSPSDLPDTPWLGQPAYNWPWIFFMVVPAVGPGALPSDAGLQLHWDVQPAVTTLGPLYLQVVYANPTGPFGRVASNGLMLDFD